jgi:membrane protease YdiL (CAAX protease family)
MTERPSEAPPAPASPTCAAAWRALLRFTCWTIGLSVAFSLIALPFIPADLDLPWWRVVRRCVSIAAAAALWSCVHRHERRTLAAYGLPGWPAGTGRREFVIGLVLGGGLLAALLSAEVGLGLLPIDVIPDRARLWRVIITFIPAALLVSVLEELVFRGYLLQHLQAYSVRAAVLLSSALYAVVHLRSLAVTPAGARELTGLLIFGIILCISYLRTGRLYLAIGLHAVLAYGARVNKLFMGSADPSMRWLVGTNRLLDGVIGWVALGVLAGLVWHVTKAHGRGGKHAG